MERNNIDVELITRLVMSAIQELDEKTIPVNISNRHVHLTERDYHTLFGDLPFVNVKTLMQPGQYASNRTVDVEGPKRTIKGVRVLGPFRSISQVELAKTDARLLGLNVPVRMSGNIEGTPGITLVGPAGQLDLQYGAIIAQRHVHMTPGDAKSFGVNDGDAIDVRVDGERPMIFLNTVVRVSENFALEMHVDSDEGNALVGKEPLSGRVVRL